MQAGELAKLSGSKLQLTEAGRNALSQPAGEALRRLWLKWIRTTIKDEPSRIECIKGQTGKGKRGLTAVSSGRGAIADSRRREAAINDLRRHMKTCQASVAKIVSNER